MTLEEKIELNKKIRSYVGNNNFINDLKRMLKSSKYLQRIKVGNKTVKFLSDNQYEAVKSSI